MKNSNSMYKAKLNSLIFLLCFSIIVCAGALQAIANPSFKRPTGLASQRPKLVVVIMIDQFRADYLTRFENRFLPARGKNQEVGGFRYLMTEGAYFPFGEYDLIQCMTGPGHATILTGSYPYQNGVPTHVWVDRSTQEPEYCASDRSSTIVGGEISKNYKSGTSPKNMIGTTIGDELKNAGYASRVVSISLKDRAAIFMGGHRANLALWFSPKSFSWVTSDYYLPNKKLPGWVTKLNDELRAQKGKKLEWKITGDGSGLSSLDSFSLLDEGNAGLLGAKGFPHTIEVGAKSSLLHRLSVEMLENAAEKAIENFELGNGKATDLLALSISTHDYLGHAYGPNSREMEELTVDEDQVISKFLNYLNAKVPGGLKNTLVVLSADHGVVSSPEWLKNVKIDAGRINEKNAKDMLETKLNEKFGALPTGGLTKSSWILHVEDFHLFLNREAIEKHELIAGKKLEIAVVEAEIKKQLERIPGVAFAVTSSDVSAGRLPPAMLGRQFMHSYYPGRSGDVVIIPKPFYIEEGYTTSHITGYSYDRTVPIILSGMGIKKGRYASGARVIDIAPTLSYLLGIIPPALSEGRVLSEALSQ